MELSKEEREQIETWMRNAEFRAADLDNDWLKGLYTGEGMGYKIILHMAEMDTEEK